MKIILAKEIGFCLGVKRALKIVKDNLPKLKKPIKMYGALVHNEEVTKKLKKEGIEIINNPREIKTGTLIITAHGLAPKIKAKLKRKKGLSFIDTTCPFVTLVQKKAEFLHKKNKKVLIFGDPNHQEVLGIKGAAKEKAIIFSSQKELLGLKLQKTQKYGLVSQTTQNFEEFKKMVEEVIQVKFPQIEIFNTICETSFKRQTEIRELAKKVDLVLIVGSFTSANTKRLHQISLSINPKSFFIRTVKDLKKEWLCGIKSIGIGSGASTPDWVIKAIVRQIKKLDPKNYT